MNHFDGYNFTFAFFISNLNRQNFGFRIVTRVNYFFLIIVIVIIVITIIVLTIISITIITYLEVALQCGAALFLARSVSILFMGKVNRR